MSLLKANPSLAYEVLMYLNSFYFGMYAACELGMGLLKAINLKYDSSYLLMRDAALLVGFCLLETGRIILGRRGALVDRMWQVNLSVFLTLPCLIGDVFLIIFQKYILRLEYVLCSLMLALHLAEIYYPIMFVFSLCRPVSYN